MPGNLPSGRERGREELRIAAMAAGDSPGPGRPHTSEIPETQTQQPGAALPIPTLSLILLSPSQAPRPPSHPPVSSHPFSSLSGSQLSPKPQVPFFHGTHFLIVLRGRRKDTQLGNKYPPPTHSLLSPAPCFLPNRKSLPQGLKQEVPLLPPK